MITLLAALVALFVVGSLLVLAGIAAGVLPELNRPRSAIGALDQLPLRILLGLGAAVLVFVATTWPVAAAYAGFAGASIPTLARAKRERQEAIERIDAIATWAESLRDIMGAGNGMQESIRVSARVAPPAIRREVGDLSRRLQHESIGTALRRFASDVAHPLADSVVAALVIASERRGGRINEVLSTVAGNARDAASMWRRIEGSRRRTYAQTRLVAATSGIFITAFVLFRRDFVEPFDSFGGQIALAIVGGVFALGGVATYRLGKPVTADRVFEVLATPDRVGDPS